MRRALSALALTGALAATSACATLSTVQTDEPYQAADGVALTLGPGVDARALVVVGGTSASGPGRLTGQFVNATNADLTVTFGSESGSTVKTTVKAHETLDLSQQDLTLATVTGKAGDMAPVTITTSAQGENVVQVPILLPQGIYQDFAPTS